MEVVDVIILIFIIFFSAMVLAVFCNRWLPESIGCKMMGWHLAPEKQGFDGCSLNGRCPRCGKSVMQDGQGNWF